MELKVLKQGKMKHDIELQQNLVQLKRHLFSTVCGVGKKISWGSSQTKDKVIWTFNFIYGKDRKAQGTLCADLQIYVQNGQD